MTSGYILGKDDLRYIINNKDGFDCQILASTYLSLEIQNPQFPYFRSVFLLTERTHRATLKYLSHIEQTISTI